MDGRILPAALGLHNGFLAGSAGEASRRSPTTSFQPVPMEEVTTSSQANWNGRLHTSSPFGRAVTSRAVADRCAHTRAALMMTPGSATVNRLTRPDSRAKAIFTVGTPAGKNTRSPACSRFRRVASGRLMPS